MNFNLVFDLIPIISASLQTHTTVRLRKCALPVYLADYYNLRLCLCVLSVSKCPKRKNKRIVAFSFNKRATSFYLSIGIAFSIQLISCLAVSAPLAAAMFAAAAAAANLASASCVLSCCWCCSKRNSGVFGSLELDCVVAVVAGGVVVEVEWWRPPAAPRRCFRSRL